MNDYEKFAVCAGACLYDDGKNGRRRRRPRVDYRTVCSYDPT